MILHRLIGFKRTMPPWMRQYVSAVYAHIMQLLVILMIGKARPLPAPGNLLIIAGYYQSVLGIGSSARLLAAALMSLGYRVEQLDFSGLLVQRDWGHPVIDPRVILQTLPHDAPIIFVMNPPHVRQALLCIGRRLLKDRFKIGYFAWELSQPPPRWTSIYPYLNEIWAISHFTSKALSTKQTLAIPVPIPLFAQPIGKSRRSDFKLPNNCSVILCAFDIRSSAIRKNAVGNITAFKKAFKATDKRVLLLLKVVHAKYAPHELAVLTQHLDGWPNIRLYQEELSDLDMLDLIASTDICLSLHRTEGFGLLPAEAMRAGNAVIATGWSGNLDFMTDSDSILISYKLVDVIDRQGLYRDAAQKIRLFWADPDLDIAAFQLRRLIDDPASRAKLGAAAAAAQNASFTKNLFAACLRQSNLQPLQERISIVL